jgi:hypothetical protein
MLFYQHAWTVHRDEVASTEGVESALAGSGWSSEEWDEVSYRSSSREPMRQTPTRWEWSHPE